MEQAPTGPSSLQSNDPAELLTARQFAFMLIVLLIAMFPGVLLFGQTFVLRDFGLFGYPLAFYHRECFWRGEIPFINPLNNCGLPFLAQWNTLTLYPGSLLYLLLPMPWAVSFFSLVHLFLAAMGMFYLARRWTGNSLAAAVAGTAFGFNGFTLNCVMWPNYIASLAWMPWLVLATERGWNKGRGSVVLAALIGALQMLSGTPEVILLAWILIGTIWIVDWIRGSGRRTVIAVRFVAIVAAIAALSAVQLLPFIDLLGHSQRSSSFDTGNWAVPLYGLANFFVPLFRFHASSSGVYFQQAQGVTSSYYVGIATLALAILAVRRKQEHRVLALAGATIFCLILSLGENLPIYGWLRRVLPILGFMRYPIKFLLLVTFAVPLLAGFATRDIFASAQSALSFRRKTVVIGVVFATIIAATLAVAWIHPFTDEELPVTMKSGLTRLLFVGGLIAVVWSWNKAADVKKQRLLAVALIALLWLDVERHVPPQNPVVRSAVFEPGLAPLHQLQPQPQIGVSRAMLTAEAWHGLHSKILSNPFEGYLCNRLGLYDNCNILDDIPKLDGFYALYLREEGEVRHAIMETNVLPAGAADFLSISQVTAPGKYFDWQARPTFMPMITAGQKPVFVSATNSLATFVSKDFDPRKTVLLPDTDKPSIAVTNESNAAVINVNWRANRINFDVEATESTMTVLSQIYYHPWKAFVDGNPTQIFRANHAFQALQVPAGRHHVTLIYKDKMFYAGAAICGITLLLCIGAGLMMRGTKADQRPS